MGFKATKGEHRCSRGCSGWSTGVHQYSEGEPWGRNGLGAERGARGFKDHLAGEEDAREAGVVCVQTHRAACEPLAGWSKTARELVGPGQAIWPASRVPRVGHLHS